MRLDLVAPSKIEELLKGKEGVNIQPSPVNQDKFVIAAECKEANGEYIAYMSKTNTPELREYSKPQFAVNALSKMGQRLGLARVSVRLELVCSAKSKSDPMIAA
ncbi:hypothetical protein [Vibrio rotiferianus]|uniref:hypothetical protein n=1 Tax=Vibrio rotiferianus TaxID=190895 RepID=UPI0005EDE7EB|nr:hypothetical protein [Vibrio rotiferianus]